MPAYIQGVDRDQELLLPERVDDYVSPNDPIRVLDAFVDGLDLIKLGFSVRHHKNNGRPSYPPCSMIKLLLWGYLNRCKSSRELEKSCYDRLGVIWLTGKLTPDHSTIADFRKLNAKGLKGLLKEFNLCCMELNLFAKELIAIDGTFIGAVNNKRKYQSKGKLKNLIRRLEKSINDYIERLKEADKNDTAVKDTEDDAEAIRAKIEELKQRKSSYEEAVVKCENSPTGSICHIDPEARPLKKRGTSLVGYNVQIAVDSKHHLVVCSDIVESANDRNQLHHMSLKAQEALRLNKDDKLCVIGDAGYGKASEVAANERIGIESHVLFQKFSDKFFTKEKFKHNENDDTLECPHGALLTRRNDYTDTASATTYKLYSSSTKVCSQCPMKRECTISKFRKVRINIDQPAAARCIQRTVDSPEIVGQRSAMVEHPFGTLKHIYFSTGLTCFGKAMAAAETSLGFLSYNIRRVLNIMEVATLVNFLTKRRKGTLETVA